MGRKILIEVEELQAMEELVKAAIRVIETHEGRKHRGGMSWGEAGQEG